MSFYSLKMNRLKMLVVLIGILIQPLLVSQNPPSSDFISKVGRLTTDLNLFLIQKHDSFSVFDAVDGVVALAWENLLDYEEYPEKRLFFKFNEDITSIEDKLYEKDLILDYNVYVKKINKDEN